SFTEIDTDSRVTMSVRIGIKAGRIFPELFPLRFIQEDGLRYERNHHFRMLGRHEGIGLISRITQTIHLVDGVVRKSLAKGADDRTIKDGDRFGIRRTKGGHADQTSRDRAYSAEQAQSLVSRVLSLSLLGDSSKQRQFSRGDVQTVLRGRVRSKYFIQTKRHV